MLSYFVCRLILNIAPRGPRRCPGARNVKKNNIVHNTNNDNNNHHNNNNNNNTNMISIIRIINNINDKTRGASRSTAVSGCTKWVTSAMCTPTRKFLARKTFRIQGLGSGVQGLGFLVFSVFSVQGSGFRVQGDVHTDAEVPAPPHR